MLVVMLAGVFDPPPETIAIPAGNLLFVVAGAVLAATLVAFGFGRLHRRPNIVALKPQ